MAQIEFDFGASVQSADRFNKALEDIDENFADVVDSVLGLSKELGISVNSAKRLSAAIGGSTDTAAQAVKRFRELNKAGVATENVFQVLNNELGITEQQFSIIRKSLKVFRQETSKTNAEIDDLGKEFEKLNEDIQTVDILQSLEGITSGLSPLQDLLGEAFSRAVESFAEFDASLEGVSIKSGESRRELESLADEARRLATVTSQTPTSALAAANSLVALGASAEEAEQRLQGILQLTDALRGVGATTENSAKVVQTALNSFEQFGETAESVADKVVLLANSTAATSSTGLDEFLQLLSKNAESASSLGIQLDELLAVFGALRDSAQEPEVAATALATLTRRLLEAREEFEAAGVQVLDASNRFVGFARVSEEAAAGTRSVLDQLRSLNLTQTQLIDLFQGNAEAAGVLIKSYDDIIKSADGLQSVNGLVSESVERVNATLAGQQALLEGNLDRAFTDLGEASSRFVIPFVQAANALVGTFNELDPAVRSVVVTIGGFALALTSALKVLATYLATLVALQALRKAGIISIARETLATTANTIAKQANDAATRSLITGNVQATASFQALGTSTFAATAALGAFAAGAIAATAVAVDTFSKTTEGANATRSEVESADKALNSYRESLLGTASGSDKAFNEDQVKRFNENLSVAQRGLERVRESLSFIPNLVTAQEAAFSRQELAFDQLIDQVGEAEQAYIDLAQRGFERGSDQANALAEAIEANIQALGRAQPVNAADIQQRDAQIERLGRLVVLLREVEEETESIGAILASQERQLGDLEEELIRTQISTNQAFIDSVRGLEEEVINSQIEVNEELTKSAEQRARELEQIEINSVQRRIRILQDSRRQIREAQGFDAEGRQRAVEQTKAIDDELLELRLELSEKIADAREGQVARELEAAEEQAKEEEELAKEREKREREQRRRREREAREAEEEITKARDSTLRRSLFNLQELRRAEQNATEDRIQEVEDLQSAEQERTDALNNQSELLEEQSRLLQIQASLRDLELEADEQGLSNARELITSLQDQSRSIQEQNLIRRQLRDIGVNQFTTELQLLDRIQKVQEERRTNEEESLEKQQEIENQLLEIENERQQIALRREINEARINELKAEQAILDQQSGVSEAEARQLAAQEALVQTQRTGTDQDIANAQLDLEIAASAVRQEQEKLSLLQEEATLNAEILAGLETEQDRLNEINQIEAERIETEQTLAQLQLAQRLEAERFADALERAALASDRVSANRFIGAQPIARRHGGPISPGNLYRVNEAGQEGVRLGKSIVPINAPRNSLLTTDTPATIVPASRMRKASNLGANVLDTRGISKSLGKISNQLSGLTEQVRTRGAQVNYYQNSDPMLEQLNAQAFKLRASKFL